MMQLMSELIDFHTLNCVWINADLYMPLLWSVFSDGNSEALTIHLVLVREPGVQSVMIKFF